MLALAMLAFSRSCSEHHFSSQQPVMKVSVKKNQKAAWNATMREEVGIVSKQAAFEEAKQRGRLITTRSSNKSASSTLPSAKRQNVHGGLSELQYKRQARLERLELTNAWDLLEKGGKSGEAVDEDYQSSDASAGASDGGGGEANEAPKKKKMKRTSTVVVTKKRTSTQLFLADVLLKDTNSQDFVNAAARKPVGKRTNTMVCDVSGKPALYVDPVTGLRVADRRSLGMLREQVPAWLKATAISPYWDAVQTIKEE